ncbi:MAG: histidine phosphatase family protein [Chitinophagaceae bacterium]
MIRHAKSSWDNATLSDFERPLNDRGKRDAPIMAKRLREKGIEIDGFVSSTAKRAKKTAQFFTKEFNVNEDTILYKSELYAAGKEIFYEVIASLSNDLDNIAIFSHNPGITEFANELTNTRVDDMPTCAIFAVKSDAKEWKEFADSTKEFWFFDYPKHIE